MSTFIFFKLLAKLIRWEHDWISNVLAWPGSILHEEGRAGNKTGSKLKGILVHGVLAAKHLLRQYPLEQESPTRFPRASSKYRPNHELSMSKI